MMPVAVPSTEPTLDQLSRDLVRDLQSPKPVTYWTDFLLSSLAGWTAFVLAVRAPVFSVPMICWSLVAMFALYRGLLFVHEISHFTRDGMRGFETAWNLLSGFPLLLPSFAYVGVHQDHHRISYYGTERDPEYLQFAKSRGMTTCFALESFLIPVLLAIRFLVIAPIGLLVPPLHRWLAIHASSLVINFKYCRDVNDKLENKMRRSELAILAIWSVAIFLAAQGILPWRTFGVWLAVVSVASFVNTIRTLGAHDYESAGQPTDRLGQLIDSIDHPGALWTELWAPVGLRYHALHHYFPGIPYHNLAEGYRRLIANLPQASEYHRSSNPSLPYSLRELYRKAGTAFVQGESNG
jgi:fatty acid desaturase